MTDLIFEWREALNSLIAAEERLSLAMDRDRVAYLAVRDEGAEAPAEHRAPRSALRSRRNLAHAQEVEHDMAEAG